MYIHTFWYTFVINEIVITKMVWDSYEMFLCYRKLKIGFAMTCYALLWDLACTTVYRRFQKPYKYPNCTTYLRFKHYFTSVKMILILCHAIQILFYAMVCVLAQNIKLTVLACKQWKQNIKLSIVVLF